MHCVSTQQAWSDGQRLEGMHSSFGSDRGNRLEGCYPLQCHCPINMMQERLLTSPVIMSRWFTWM